MTDLPAGVHTFAMIRPPFPTLCRAIWLLGWLLPTAHAQVPQDERAMSTARDEIGTACERAVRQSLTVRNGVPSDLQFAPPLSAGTTSARAPSRSLRGSGTWRDTKGQRRRFEYRCDVDPDNVEAVGVIVRDLTPSRPQTAPATIEPDLRHISPAGCESAAAMALSKRWPQVAQISFDSRTRRIVQTSATRANLREQGQATPSPGAATMHFEASCDVDPRDGRVLRVQVSE